MGEVKHLPCTDHLVLIKNHQKQLRTRALTFVELAKATTQQEQDAMARKLSETTALVNADAGKVLLFQLMQSQPSCSDYLTLGKSIDEHCAFFDHQAALLHALEPRSPVEAMLCSQMITAHNMAMDYARKANYEAPNDLLREKYFNRASKMMNLYVQQMQALDKHRTKGKQVMQVQHVQVNAGQAIVSNVQNGGVRTCNQKLRLNPSVF